MPKRFAETLRALFHTSDRERKRILLLLPLLLAVCLLFLWQGKPRFEQSFTRYTDRVIDSLAAPTYARTTAYPGRTASGQYPSSAPRTNTIRTATDSLFHFNPNTISLEELVRLGFSQRQAQGILNYRNAGKVFYKPDDFADCYTVSDEKFRQLRPYIRITPVNTASPRSDNAPQAVPTATATVPQPEVQPQPAAPSRPDQPRALLDLNTADSAALVGIRGIGALTAGRIVAYRNRLGGFRHPEQLAEVQGMTERNYELILQQIFVNDSKIQKIDINFAPPEQLKGHPYLPSQTLNKILKHRQLKGGWRTIGELVEDEIMTQEEAGKLAAYLYFSAP